MARVRRSKEDMLKDKITKCDEDIKKCSERIKVLTDKKKEIEKELNELLDTKHKAEQAKKLSSLVDLMDEKGYTIEDLEKLMSMPKPVEE